MGAPIGFSGPPPTLEDCKAHCDATPGCEGYQASADADAASRALCADRAACEAALRRRLNNLFNFAKL